MIRYIFNVIVDYWIHVQSMHTMCATHLPICFIALLIHTAWPQVVLFWSFWQKFFSFDSSIIMNLLYLTRTYMENPKQIFLECFVLFWRFYHFVCESNYFVHVIFIQMGVYYVAYKKGNRYETKVKIKQNHCLEMKQDHLTKVKTWFYLKFSFAWIKYKTWHNVCFFFKEITVWNSFQSLFF